MKKSLLLISFIAFAPIASLQARVIENFQKFEPAAGLSWKDYTIHALGKKTHRLSAIDYSEDIKQYNIVDIQVGEVVYAYGSKDLDEGIWNYGSITDTVKIPAVTVTVKYPLNFIDAEDIYVDCEGNESHEYQLPLSQFTSAQLEAIRQAHSSEEKQALANDLFALALDKETIMRTYAPHVEDADYLSESYYEAGEVITRKSKYFKLSLNSRS